MKSLACLVKGHHIEPLKVIGYYVQKRPEFPVCLGCNRRIIWDHKAQQYVLTNPFKR